MFRSLTVHDLHCERLSLSVTNLDALARTIALVLVQEYDLAKNIIHGIRSSEIANPSAEEVEQIIAKRLMNSPKFHRDGFLFQLIMWLSSHLDLPETDLIALPHSQPAAKGQDSVIIHRTDGAVVALSICEDKATTSPRKTIQEKVWPEILDYEGGGRDDELRSSIIATLGTAGISTAEATKLIRGISWEGKRRYRVRVSVDATTPDRTMFKGFAELTPGGKASCRGETIHLPSVRDWMADFSARVQKELRGLTL